jgi:cobalt-zinc-cadmium efflux system protein
VLGVGILGLLVNVISLWLLQGGDNNNLNLRGAYLEVLADALGSLGVIIAAVVILVSGWVRADAVVALAIALWMIPGTWVLLRDAGRVLLEQRLPLQAPRARAAFSAPLQHQAYNIAG